MKITVDHSSSMNLVNDSVVIERARLILDSGVDTTICQVIVMDAIRMLIKKGEFNYKDVVFEFHGEQIRIDKNGMLEAWPDGFCEGHTNILIELL